MHNRKSESEEKCYEELTEQTEEVDLPYIGDREKAPEWILEGNLAETGFRINFNSTRRALSSAFMIHNESVNIWSHFCGSLFFAIFVCIVTFALSSGTFNEIP